MDILTVPTSALMLAWHNGFILAVSRRNAPDDLGLPGGKVQGDETALTAAIREMREETGIVPDDRVTEVHSRSDGTPSGRKVVVFETRIQAVRPRIVAEDGIRVVWARPERLAYGNTFSDFNSELFSALGLELLPEVGDAVISGPGLLGPPDTIRGAISSLRSSIDMIGRNP